MTNQTTAQFESAARLYAAAPNAQTLLNLHRRALPLLSASREAPWRSVDAPAEAFALARLFMFQGTPLRKTDRVAPCGTRLVEGIAPCHVALYVR